MPQCTAFSDSAPSGRQIDGVLRGLVRSTASGSLRLVPVRQFRLEFRYVVINSIKGRTERNGLALGKLPVAAGHRFNPCRTGKVDRIAHPRTVRRFIAPLHTTDAYPHSSCDNVLIFRSVRRERRRSAVGQALPIERHRDEPSTTLYVADVCLKRIGIEETFVPSFVFFVTLVVNLNLIAAARLLREPRVPASAPRRGSRRARWR